MNLRQRKLYSDGELSTVKGFMTANFKKLKGK